MRLSLVVHIVGGSLGILSGFVALSASKGRTLHRRSGTLFVWAMLAMCLSGTLIAVVRGVAPAINVPAGLLTSCLVVTALTTVRAPTRHARPLLVGTMLLSFGVGAACLALGSATLAGVVGKRDARIIPFVMFGAVGLLAAAGDLRVLRAGPPRGAARLARHLWRMTFALFIAALSFFIGQAKVIPAPVRIPGLLALPVLAVLVIMLYWLWRVRARPKRLPAVMVPAR